MKFDSSDKIVLNITNTCNNNNIFFLTDPKNLQKISNLQHCLKFYDLSPVYTIQVLHPSLHSRKLGSRKLEFKFVYTRCKKF